MNTIYDLIVVGGGPAGMIAAGRAASLGSRVLLLEKNRSLGRKLLLSGGGRCNVTNLQPNTHALVGRYGDQGKRLYSVLTGFGPQEMLQFLNDHGVATKVEAENRAFPEDNRAESVLHALEQFMQAGGVQIQTEMPVQGLERLTDQSGLRVYCSGERFFDASWVLLATGGFARPETGSTGDALPWLEALGHGIHRPDPILVPVRTREPWTSQLMGISCPDAVLRVCESTSSRELHRARGKLLFTHFGLSGPLVLNASARIKELSQQVESPLFLYIDLIPFQTQEQTEHELLKTCSAHGKRQLSTILCDFLPPKVAHQVYLQSGLPESRKASELSKAERRNIVTAMHGLRMTFGGHLGSDKAIVSRGGVELDQVDFKTMESRIVPGLLFAGDILDFDRPSGGFSLQICWSTGWRAGERAAGAVY